MERRRYCGVAGTDCVPNRELTRIALNEKPSAEMMANVTPRRCGDQLRITAYSFGTTPYLATVSLMAARSSSEKSVG